MAHGMGNQGILGNGCKPLAKPKLSHRCSPAPRAGPSVPTVALPTGNHNSCRNQAENKQRAVSQDLKALGPA